MLAAAYLNGSFAFRLRSPICVQRIHGIAFSVRRALASIENVVSRVVNEECATLPRGAPKRGRSTGVYSAGHLRFALRFVDCCVSSRVHDHRRFALAHEAANFFWIREIQE